MTRLDALFVPNNILNCHIPDRNHLSNCHISDKIKIQTAIFRMVLRPSLHLLRLIKNIQAIFFDFYHRLAVPECLVYVCPRTETMTEQ